MHKVALIVASNYKELIKGHAAVDEPWLLQREFGLLDVDLSLCSYTDPSVDWSTFDAVIPKSAWDYFHDPRGFVRWLDKITAMGVRSINDAELIKWNHDKSYLADLWNAGVLVAPFTYFPQGSDPAAVVTEYKMEGWDRAVLKPAVSAGAWKTELLDVHEELKIESVASEILRGSGLVVQPFFQEIQTDGEWSVYFIDGEPSHAVVKTPKAGDFRSQAIWGGHTRPEKAPDWLLDATAKVLYAAPLLPTYGRVDGFVRDGEFHLMELELIEPYFFFELAPAYVLSQFAEAVVSRL
jgi:glutathione synthase/RimK-type ligase-like ATP-grasp enzyme